MHEEHESMKEITTNDKPEQKPSDETNINAKASDEIQQKHEEAKVPVKTGENVAPILAVEEIKNFPGYNELDDKEKKLCEELLILPKAYQTFKGKMQQKASKSRNAVRRVAALEFVDKQIIKNKALSIFDFMAANNLLSKPE